MKLSIITVVLNDSQNLLKTINSIRSQKKKYDFEYIVVDGLSIDNTIGIVNKNRDMIDIFITEKDEGIFDAMNKGINYSSGEFLWFINSGDTLIFNAIERVFAVTEADCYDIIHGQTLFNNLSAQCQVLEFDKLDYKLLKKFNNIPHPSTLINKKVFSKYGKYNSNYKISADYDFFCKLVKSSTNINNINIKTPLVLMQAAGVSDYTTSAKFPLKILKETFLIQIIHFGFLNASISSIKNFFHFLKVFLSQKISNI